mmetsp:Transcript_49184/g.107233  ORF Transcript_49184/g.107233 Transcript_49184/m.107233 type:complete len:298 (-) Transcript_49184:631-1524(-)
MGELLQALLDHMIPVHIADQTQDIRLQSGAELGNLGVVVGFRNCFNQPLHRSRAMHVQADAGKVGGADVQELRALLSRDHLEHHLHEVIAEGVLHELHHMLLGLLKHAVDHFLLPVVELLLQGPAPALVLRGLVHASLVFLPGQLGHYLLMHLPAPLVGRTISGLPPRLAGTAGAAPSKPHPQLSRKHWVRQAESIKGQGIRCQRIQPQAVQVKHRVQERIVEAGEHRHVNSRQRSQGHGGHHSLRPGPQIGALGGVCHPLLKQSEALLSNGIQGRGIQPRGLHPPRSRQPGQPRGP